MEHLRQIFFVAICIQLVLTVALWLISLWEGRQITLQKLGMQIKLRYEYLGEVDTLESPQQKTETLQLTSDNQYTSLDLVQKFVHRDFWHRHFVV